MMNIEGISKNQKINRHIHTETDRIIFVLKGEMK